MVFIGTGERALAMHVAGMSYITDISLSPEHHKELYDCIARSNQPLGIIGHDPQIKKLFYIKKKAGANCFWYG